jgi:hypothetical protein
MGNGDMNRPAEVKEALDLLDDLEALKFDQQQEAAPQVVCAWCSNIKREGSLPASHGICDECAEREFGQPLRLRWLRNEVSPSSQPISAEDLTRLANAGPSDTNGQSLPELEVGITSDELTSMTRGILADKPVSPSSPYAARVLERLKVNIAALPLGAVVEIPSDFPDGPVQEAAWRRWPMWSLFFALLLCAHGLSAQVTVGAVLRDGVTELRIMNPTAAPLSVEMSLYRDATKADGPVTLGDSISALISPRSFILQPGQVQAVRLRVREAVKPNELLRLATMFTPLEALAAEQGIRLLVRTRLITKVVVQ